MRVISDQTTLSARVLVLAIAALGALALLLVSASQPAAARTGGIASPDTRSAETSTSSKAGKYTRLWKKTSRRDRRWARRTAECESGRDPKAIGGGGQYRGAFQFLKSTWKTSPKSPGGDPIKYRYRTQAVVAIALKKRDSARHWPVCG